MDAENMRDFVSYHYKFMKWKFSLSANLELKFCWKIFTKITKVHGDFLLNIGIIWFRDIKKDYPLL